MARTLLTKLEIGQQSITCPANSRDFVPAAADVANGNAFVHGPRAILYAYNSGATTRTVTVTAVADTYGRTGSLVYSLATGEYAMLGPFPAGAWKQSDGLVYVDGAHAEVKLSVVELT